MSQRVDGGPLLLGAAVGAVAAVSNVYVSLKVGWSLPVMSTAAMIGIGAARLRGKTLDARDAVVMTSFASAAGYMAGGGNVAALPAFAMLGGDAPSPVALAAWFATIALLGTFAAPLFGDRIARDLRFPTATATATLVQGLDGKAARPLLYSALASAAIAAGRKLAAVPAALLVPGGYTFGVDTSLLLAGVGALMTPKTAWSTLLGGAVTYGVVAPAIAATRYDAIVRFMVWPAAALLVASALTELALDLPRLVRRSSVREAAPRDLRPLAVLAVAAVVLERVLFGIPWTAAVLALPAALLIAYVACRAMGETDVVPTKALAPIAQLGFAAVASGLAAPAIAPNLTSSVALQAADTLGSLKAASLLGTPPREALLARAGGCVLGAAVVVVAYRAILPDPTALPTAELPAPAVLVWKSVLEIAGGALPDATRAAIAAGAALGVVLGLLGRLSPPRVAAWVPSPMGLGSGMVLPGSSAVTMTIGAIARAVVDRGRTKETGAALASGTIAGESVAGIAIQLLAGR